MPLYKDIIGLAALSLAHLPPILCYSVGTKIDGKFFSGKVTIHCPTPRCDSFLSGKGSEDSRLKRRGLLVANDWKPKEYIEKKNNTVLFVNITKSFINSRVLQMIIILWVWLQEWYKDVCWQWARLPICTIARSARLLDLHDCHCCIEQKNQLV